MGSFSEEEVEDVVIEIVCREEPFELAHRQRVHFVWELGIGISVDDRYLVPLGVSIQLVIRMIRLDGSIPFIDNARDTAS